jgi:hypothetical protein
VKPLKSKRAWTVAYDPQYFLQMAEEYGEDRLEQLNECLGKGDYALVSEDSQGFAGDLVIDFHSGQDLNEPSGPWSCFKGALFPAAQLH